MDPHARPSYPLFDEIARIAGVRTVAYRLDESRSWSIDLADLEDRISPAPARSAHLAAQPHGRGGVGGRARRPRRDRLATRCRSSPTRSSASLPELDRLRPANRAPLVIALNGFQDVPPGIKLAGWRSATTNGYVRC
jgi:hypothetical protein